MEPRNGRCPICASAGPERSIVGAKIQPDATPWRVERAMSKIDDLKAEVEKLPSEEFSEFFRWMTDKDWKRWDREIEADSDAGKLDFLVREAREARLKGTLKAL
jgi:hypothetical protein